jgi:uncharacterized protein YdaU (DUF1376 family)
MNGLPYYKAYPRDFIEGTIGMPFELKGAYRLLLDLIYMQGGALPDDARYISGQLGCSVKKWKSLREALIDADKIEVRGDYLGNDRADKELETLGKLQDKQRENRSRPNKNKHIQSPRCDHTEPDTERTVAKATDGDAVEPQDFAKQLWDRGVQFLGRHGVKDRQARTIIGKWRKAYTDTDIFEAFSQCSRAGAVEPVSWIEAKLKSKGTGNVRTAKGASRLAAFVGGASGTPRLDRGPDRDPARPLLARG